MLITLLLFVLQAAADFISYALLLRFLMQWRRAPFRNVLGRFAINMTDWIVIPLRRIIPSAFGLDLPSLLLVWFAQFLYLWLSTAIGDVPMTTLVGFGMLAFLALFEILRLLLWLLTVAALVLWINPGAAFAAVLYAILEPFYAPFRGKLPPIRGFDFTPMLFLLVIQALLVVIGWARATLFPMLFL